MTRRTTEVPDIVRSLLQAHVSWEEAIRRDDAAASDAAAERGTALLQELATTGDGRAALEALLEYPSPGLRLGVAATAVDWNPERAVPVLARLMHEELDPNGTHSENAGIRMHARLMLMEYFGIRDYDPAPLPDRLAAMGIVLPDSLRNELRHR